MLVSTELKLAQTHMRVRVLLLVEDWSSSTPALATHAVVTALVLASVVLLLVLTPLPWSSPDHAALSLADLICSVLLLADWLLRCGLYFSLSCSRKELLRSLTPKIEWLIVDGVASSVHVLSAALTLIQFGDKLAVDLIACLRVLRLISLVRNSKTFDMVLRVLWQSAEALKGPMYWMAVSTVFFGIVVYYIEFFLTPETADIDTLGNAIWYSIVTFSTVGYGDISPTTWLGKVVATFGIVTGMIWFAMPITIIGANFQAEWERCNVRLVAEALQTELLENNEMTQDLVPAAAFSPPGRRPSQLTPFPSRPSNSPLPPCNCSSKGFARSTPTAPTSWKSLNSPHFSNRTATLLLCRLPRREVSSKSSTLCIEESSLTRSLQGLCFLSWTSPMHSPRLGILNGKTRMPLDRIAPTRGSRLRCLDARHRPPQFPRQPVLSMWRRVRQL